MDWEERSAKEVSRNFFLSRMPKRDKILYLGLPGDKACFEKKLFGTYEEVSAVLFEKDQASYNSCQRILGRMNLAKVHLLKEDIDTYILNNPAIVSSADVCWLDYCGCISYKRIEVMNSFLRNSKDDSVLGLTFLCSREPDNIGPEIQKEDYPVSYLKRIHFLLKHIETPVSIECLPYMDTVPMVLFVIKKAEKTSLLIHPFVRG